jgi:hypothetical protein
MVAVLEVRVLLTMLARSAVPVAVMLVPVAFPKRRLVMEAVRALRKLEKKLVEVELVIVALVATMLSLTVLEAVTLEIETAPAFKLVIVVVASIVVPLAVRLPVEMEPELIAPEERVPVFTLTKVGFGDTAPL